MGNDVLQQTGRDAGTDTPVSELHQRQDTGKNARKVVKAFNWTTMTMLVMQMQEHMETLQVQASALDGDGQKALSGLAHCADELLPDLLAEARRVR